MNDFLPFPVILDDHGNPILGDGHCTGFPDGIGPWDWRHCCVEHDAGATNGQLLDCITDTVPDWAAVLVAFCIMLMIWAHPVYEWLQRKGWVK